jgi:TolB-like protein
MNCSPACGRGRQADRATDGSQGRALSGALRDAVTKALAQDPAGRYADAASFAEGSAAFRRRGYGTREAGPYADSPSADLRPRRTGTGRCRRRCADSPAQRTPPPCKALRCCLSSISRAIPDREILADGLAEEVANRLAAIPDLRVTGRRSSFSFKGKNEDLRVIAKKLDVANLLEGSLRTTGTQLRITVNLIDGRDGTRRWSSRPYEHEHSGILAAQDEIAQDVARALSVTLDVGALNRAQGGTRNLEAARRYWEWRELMLSERIGIELERRKVRLMREAVRRDPQFVVAWDGLAGSLSTLARYIDDTHPEQAEQLRAEAEQAWGRVAELAPDSWIALKKRSDDLLRAEKWAESEAVARQILESGPFTFERAEPLSNVTASVGRLDEAIELQAQMLALEPQAMFVSAVQQWNFYAAERFEEVEAEYQRSQTLAGSHFSSDLAALLRGLAQPDADPQTLRELFQRLRSENDRPVAAKR